MPTTSMASPDGQEIQRLRQEKLKITRPALARKIGCHPQTVWDVERKSIRISERLLARFAKALKVKTEVISLPEAAEDDEAAEPGEVAA